MILTFAIPLILFAFLLLTKKKLVRKHWLMLFSFGLVFTFLVSFFSVWSAWNPNMRIPGVFEVGEPSYLYVHFGKSLGVSALSYPLELSIYGTSLTDQNSTQVDNCSIDISFAHQKMVETNGTLSFNLMTWLIGGPSPVSYQFGPPFYSDAVYFFGFLIFVFILFNVAGFALGLVLCCVISRVLHKCAINELKVLTPPVKSNLLSYVVQRACLFLNSTTRPMTTVLAHGPYLAPNRGPYHCLTRKQTPPQTR